MKMKDLKKLGKRADEILKERKEKTNNQKRKMQLLLKACEADLIKKPSVAFFSEIEKCPECGHILDCEINWIIFGSYYHCPSCEYEYIQ